MNKRLTLISEYIENSRGLVDVGTDHGYLPIHLAESGYTGNIIASDINEDPLSKAYRNAIDAGFRERICFLLCDGLKGCPPERVDTIVIAGMGGDMIVKILDEAPWCMDPAFKLILQPMSKAEVLRYWLTNNGFEICNEELVDENMTIYQIMVCKFGTSSKHNDAELFSGRYEACSVKTLYKAQLLLLNKRFSKALDSMSKNPESPKYRIKLFTQILEQLKEMENKYD